MTSLGMQMLASALSLVGWAMVIIICVAPLWRVTAFVGSTIVTSQTIWEGIWMTCVVQSTGQIQCKPYDSLLALSSDLQAARALTVLAITTGGIGLVLAFVGGKCTRFLDEEHGGAKGRIAVAAGATLIATGVLCLIPTSWVAGAVVRKFYSAAIDAQRREIGACLYIGWGASILLVLGGGLFISSSCPLKAHDADKSPSVRYLVVRTSTGGSTQAASQQPSRGPSITAASSPTGGLVYTQPPWEKGPAARSGTGASGGGSRAASTKSQLKRPQSILSEQSDGASTKSQLKRPESILSELSEGASTKSQLKRNASRESLAELSESHVNADESTNPARTYI